MLAPDVFINCCQAHMLSPFGRCRSFDAAADGYTRGEGCGMSLLGQEQLAAHGMTDGFGVPGSFVNHDGKGQSLTSPNPSAQSAVIHQALRCATMSPDNIDLIEAHGTGTKQGDPVEIKGLEAIFKDSSHPLSLSIPSDSSVFDAIPWNIV